MVDPLVLVVLVDKVDGTRVIQVAGEIDAATAPQLAKTLEQCNGASVCVDLGGVTFIDSTGLAVLIAAHKRAAERDTEFGVVNPASNVQRVFELTNLDYLLPLGAG